MIMWEFSGEVFQGMYGKETRLQVSWESSKKDEEVKWSQEKLKEKNNQRTGDLDMIEDQRP